MKPKNKKLVFCLFSVFVLILLCLFYFFNFSNTVLSEQDAFIMVYGNYDLTHKSALWKDMNIPHIENFGKDIWGNKTGVVNQVFFKPFTEDRKQKIFFITKTIPTGQPYECHACLPILNATVFIRNKKTWEIESQNLFLIQEGEYAASPITHLVQIGPNHYGVTLEYEHRSGELLTKDLYLIISHKKSIMNALEETIYADNFNACGWGTQCTTFSSTLHFSETHHDEFYLLKIKRFGTRNDEKQHDRAIPVDEESTYQFRAGKYTQIDWKGFPKINYETSQ